MKSWASAPGGFLVTSHVTQKVKSNGCHHGSPAPCQAPSHVVASVFPSLASPGGA